MLKNKVPIPTPRGKFEDGDVYFKESNIAFNGSPRIKTLPLGSTLVLLHNSKCVGVPPHDGDDIPWRVEADGEGNRLYRCLHKIKDIKGHPTGQMCAHPAVKQSIATNISSLITHSKTHWHKVNNREDNEVKKAALAKEQLNLKSMFTVTKKKMKDPPKTREAHGQPKRANPASKDAENCLSSMEI